METFAREIFSLFFLPLLKGEKLGGKMTHSLPGTFNFKSLELRWARPGCGTPGAFQSFISPFHVILWFSNPWKKYLSRAEGEGNPLLFDLQVFLLSIKAFASSSKHFASIFSKCIFTSHGFVWNTKKLTFSFSLWKRTFCPSALCLYFTVVS